MYNHSALLKDIHYFLTYVNNLYYQKISLPTPWLWRVIGNSRWVGDGEGSQKPNFCKRKTVWSYTVRTETRISRGVGGWFGGGGRPGEVSNQNSSLGGEAWIFCGTYKYDKVHVQYNFQILPSTFIIHVGG